MKRLRAWEKFDASFISLEDTGSSGAETRIATLWDGGQQTGVITANEEGSELYMLDPTEWRSTAPASHAADRYNGITPEEAL